ncbi:hypothetical protein BG015_008718 [Linnemannia schmuckeri]|uniref:Potassium channel domain-containing protein n=1 Tax=Linnemannia schmuckeri TaxID=64567 RepID=A0A9P5RZ85_9FUNG|nr:hypothetical protein BG015_008718 [Linnemannia schmuckeri]
MEANVTGGTDSDNNYNSEKIHTGSSQKASKRLAFLQTLRFKDRLQPRPMRPSKHHVPIDTDELEANYRIMPLAIGCIIPASILINVPSLTSEWVGRPEYDPTTETWGPPTEIPIPHWMSSMVIAALVMAIVCNLCVLSRFLERHIWHSVVLSLITASLQDVLCIGAIIPFCLMYPTSEGYVYLEGFWSMVASLSFSTTATVLISIDLHRTPQFRLQGSGVTHKQRMLIAQAMAFCFYLAIGALIFIWIEDWTFLEALFFVMITITTIGFGDTVPKTAGGRVFVVFYASGGIVLFAMAVNAIRYVILEDLHRQFAVRAQERKAKKEARRLERKEERQRELERQKRVQGTLENIQKMELLKDQVGAGTEMYQNSIFRRHFTVPHETTIRLPALFHPQGSVPNPKEQRIPSISITDVPNKETILANEASIKTNLEESARLVDLSSRDVPARLLTSEPRIAQSKGALADEMEPSANRYNSAGNINATRTDSHHYGQRMHEKLFELVVRWYYIFGRACGFKEAANCASIAAPMASLKKQREADKELAYKESMQEYRRRLRFSFAIFMCFWLAGAAIYQTLEPWSYGQAMYFSFIAFSSIGYGDLVPLSLAGRAIFLAYCLVGVVTLTSLASLISEVLSKSLRRHVVETQLRRSERFMEQKPNVSNRRASDADLEQGDVFAEVLENEQTREDDQQEERLQTLRILASTVATEHLDAPGSDDTCQGSLRNLVQVSRDFDILLQKVLGLDHASPNSVATNALTAPSSTIPTIVATDKKAKAQVPLIPDKILDYLEKEEEEFGDPSFLSPSISRDITSTSSIHRNSIATLGQNFMDLKANGTYHGAGPSSTSISSPSSESQFNIRAWSKGSSTASTKNHSDNERHHPLQSRLKTSQPLRHTTQPAPVPQPANDRPSTTTTHRHNHDGSVTISAIHWKHLIEYSKQFRILTDTCDEALQKLLAWEAAERKRRLRQKQAKERQRRLLQARRRRLFELGGTYGAIDDGIEDEAELEELDGWCDEGSDTDEDDEYEEDDDGDDADEVDKNQEGIARTLLETIETAPDSQTRRPRGQARVAGAPIHQWRHRSRSRPPVAASGDGWPNVDSADIGIISDEMRKGSVEDDSFNTAVVKLSSESDRIPRALHHSRGPRERRRSTSRG